MGSGLNFFKNWIDISPNEIEQYVTINCQGLIPLDSTGIILRLANQWYSAIAGVRAKGSTDNFSEHLLMSNKNHVYAFCGVDENFCFEAFCKNAAYASYGGNPVKIYLCGYTDEAVVFFPDAIETGTFGKAWSSWSAAPYVPPEATGGIFLVYNTHPTTGQQFAIRGYGSTDQHYDGIEYGWHATHLAKGGESTNFCYPIIAFGQDKKIEFVDRNAGGYLKLKLIGYTKLPVYLFLNSIKKLVTVSDIWQGIDFPEINPNADGTIMELRNIAPGGKPISIREPGSTNNDIIYSRLGLETAFWGACGVENQQIEAYADWAEKAMFFVHGYTLPTGIPQEFPCPYCGEVFTSQEELTQHILSEHTFLCPHCPETFTSQEDLNVHITTDHNFPCPYCQEIFPSQNELDNHIQQEHTFPCPHCSEVFTTQEELDEHFASEHPQGQTISITMESGNLEGDVVIIDGHISMDITSGHIEGTLS